MRLEVALTAHDKSRPVTTLQYVSSPTEKGQARFNGRVALRPKIDFAGYSCGAVIDVIELSIVLSKPTQWMWVKDEIDGALGINSFVESVPKLTVSQTFRIRVQDPTMGGLKLLAHALDARFGIDAQPVVTELEVSVDFRPKKPDQAARDLMFGVLVRHHMPETDIFSAKRDRPRYSWARGEGNISHVFGDSRRTANVFEKIMLSTEHDRQVLVDATYYVGAKGAHVQWSIMDKVKDHQNIGAGTLFELNEKQKRTRIEVTLSQEALKLMGLKELSDLQTFNFRGLQRKFFNFKLATFESRSPGKMKAVSEAIERYRAEKFLVTGILGLAGRDTVRSKLRATNRSDLLRHFRLLDRSAPPLTRRGVGTAGTTMAFAELNKMVETALRHLGERVSR